MVTATSWLADELAWPGDARGEHPEQRDDQDDPHRDEVRIAQPGDRAAEHGRRAGDGEQGTAAGGQVRRPHEQVAAGQGGDRAAEAVGGAEGDPEQRDHRARRRRRRPARGPPPGAPGSPRGRRPGGARRRGRARRRRRPRRPRRRGSGSCRAGRGASCCSARRPARPPPPWWRPRAAPTARGAGVRAGDRPVHASLPPRAADVEDPREGFSTPRQLRRPSRSATTAPTATRMTAPTSHGQTSAEPRWAVLPAGRRRGVDLRGGGSPVRRRPAVGARGRAGRGQRERHHLPCTGCPSSDTTR